MYHLTGRPFLHVFSACFGVQEPGECSRVTGVIGDSAHLA